METPNSNFRSPPLAQSVPWVKMRNSDLKNPDQFLRNVAPSDEHRSKKTMTMRFVVALIIKKMMGVKEERRWLGNTTSGDGYPLFIIFAL